uniref:30S ribosomal protein S4 n=1 Tax=Lotharella vacuolata TaxID=74820 RepID=A0A140JZV0_9EUKA|nr:30S ribosomal protein S4 [Lotharella vacuolata]BAU62627.1 30S ribosomal protein S4 [Lotharella vacuolata]
MLFNILMKVFFMARYNGSRLKIVRRLGLLPGFTKKVLKKSTKALNFKKLSQYGLHLQEKQKLRYNYGVSEKELIRYVQKARKKNGDTGQLLLQFLENRLDSLLYKVGITSTILAARQLIAHGHIYVNNTKVTVPGFYCETGVKISLKKSLLKKFSKVVNKDLDGFTFVDNFEKIIIVKMDEPDIKQLGFSLNILLVLEYYAGN